MPGHGIWALSSGTCWACGRCMQRGSLVGSAQHTSLSGTVWGCGKMHQKLRDRRQRDKWGGCCNCPRESVRPSFGFHPFIQLNSVVCTATGWVVILPFGWLNTYLERGKHNNNKNTPKNNKTGKGQGWMSFLNKNLKAKTKVLNTALQGLGEFGVHVFFFFFFWNKCIKTSETMKCGVRVRV